MSSRGHEGGSASSQAEALLFAARIQSTIISNSLTRVRWEEHVAECLEFRFQAAMIPPCWVKATAQALAKSGIRVASFVDFPYGTMTSRGKAFEASSLAEEGAEEIDMMTNVGFLLSGMETEYFQDVRGVVKAVAGIPVKVMLELPLLNPQQRERAVALSVDAGVAYLKNVSGGTVGIAKPEEIRFLRRLAPPNVRIKASGGIKTAAHVRELIEAGADLVGTSAGAKIIQEIREGEAASEANPAQY